ncbi:hypothetical protein K2Z83_13500 [Oscillochloris sp. ZM17-4]|uniref:hypothetical protein n=1 Tax=Oscillochloris sp. ZM17-4 TaxID=2866714 RepID=UPI001C731F81|nr:hypothetical protein [Oscillochloris sp. ZM17-4]MBX0328692.1 hypothetical protein [Oscillochloris sp. ZM17-4]
MTTEAVAPARRMVLVTTMAAELVDSERECFHLEAALAAEAKAAAWIRYGMDARPVLRRMRVVMAWVSNIVHFESVWDIV